VTVLPHLTGMTGFFYLFGALLLGGGFLYYALKLKFAPFEDSPMATFRYSIWYLMALFSFLLIDHYIPAFWPA
jgi:protoheme IX farnesyltransferase